VPNIRAPGCCVFKGILQKRRVALIRGLEECFRDSDADASKRRREEEIFLAQISGGRDFCLAVGAPLGIRRGLCALAAPTRWWQSGRGLPQSRTLARGSFTRVDWKRRRFLLLIFFLISIPPARPEIKKKITITIKSLFENVELAAEMPPEPAGKDACGTS
jgi:hypothetical protein